MKAEYLDIAKKYKESLIDMGLPVDKFFVFGSTVRGTEHKWSDLDVCVISPVFGADRIGDRVFLMNVSGKISSLIEPHPMTLEDLSNRFDPFSNEVRKYGIEI